jgi:ABC-type Mn2+/Zn2+ transport system ATPase subunit
VIPAVELDRVTYRYPRSEGAPALDNVTLRVEPGEMLSIVGPNGGGKSTLLKLLLGLLPGYSGRASVMGRDPDEARRSGLIGWVPQRTTAELSFPISARQAVLMAAERTVPGWKRTPASVRAGVDQAMVLTGAAEHAHKPVGALSGGQWQRVMIARALASGARILALDEPLSGVDAPGQARFGAMLRDLHAQLGLTILMVTHDLRALAGASKLSAGAPGAVHRVACLRSTLHFHAAPQGVTPQLLAEVFRHDLADVFGDVHVDAHRAADCADPHHDASRDIGGASGTARLTIEGREDGSR